MKTLAAVCLLLASCGRGDTQDAVASYFPDSRAVRFQAIKEKDDLVCGEVHAVGAGGTRGYTRFIFDVREKRVVFAPEVKFTAADVDAFMTTCRLSGDNYDLCSRADEAKQGYEAGVNFVKRWRRGCVD